MQKSGKAAAGGKAGGKRRQHGPRWSHKEEEEVARLEEVIAAQAPPRGANTLALRPAADGAPTFAAARRFDELPLSQRTRDGLRECKYVTLTAIQRAALPHALAGRDVLGAAKTGSGKTLAFLIPALEALHRARWGRLDGLGALVISPTRELALQIFDTLRRVGARHELSAALLVGGRGVAEEAARVAGINLLVATPGRLLQHMDETPGFDAGALRVLVLDEADRILDMGFAAALDAIVANLPRARQTLLFSATQTKSVAALARLSLRGAEYVEAHSDVGAPTPARLEQAFMETPAPAKLDVLWSFIKTHLRARTIVFVSTCKQVRFLYEALRRLRPGVPLRALHGKMGQARRVAVYQAFCADAAGVLFATDVAARGLDFPSVDWVVQADAPEDAAAYIHRVGRTARYTAAGRGLLLLLPSERAGALAALAAARVPLRELRSNPARLQPVGPALAALLSKDAELKDSAQRALVAYLRSVFLQPDKATFDVSAIPVAELAMAWGLPNAPRLRFLRAAGAAKKRGGGASSADEGAASSGEEESEDEDEGAARAAPAGAAPRAADGGDDGGDLLTVKRRYEYPTDADAPRAAGAAAELALALPAPKKKRLKISATKASAGATRVVFDDDGERVEPLALLARDEKAFAHGRGGAGLDLGVHATVEERAAAARAALGARDAEDRAALRGLRKEARDERRGRRLAREAEEGAARVAGSGSESDGDDGGSDGGYESGGGGSDSDGGGGAGGGDIDLLASSDDDDAPAAGRDPSCMDMRPAAAPPAGKRRRGTGTADLPLEEAEALALRLLRGG
jgi:ATP-dependent RNA helicase DDX10/DBP4